ncbi:MAG TPA: ABC transporter ATP-binding protein, partial [Candidatus Coprovivens excrementavium]|nr:ABC transporter ATP-binding protein [Candidatus Coprovivens excrementavium]
MVKSKKEKFDNAWNNLKKTFYYAKKQKKEFIIYFIANILLAFLGAIVPLLSANQLLKLTDGLLADLLIVSITILIVEISVNFCRFFARKYAQIFTREILKHIQIDIAGELLKVETSDLDKKSSGVFIDRLVRDTGRIADIFLNLNLSLTDLVTNIGILFAIFVTNKILFIYYVLGMLIIFYLERRRIKKYNVLDKHYRKSAEATTGLIGELVRGIRDIKVLNAGDSFMRRISQKITDINQERYEMSNVLRTYRLFTGSVHDILDFLYIVLAIFLISNNFIEISNVVIIYMYKGRVFNLLTIMSQVMEWFKDFNLSASRV